MPRKNEGKASKAGTTRRKVGGGSARQKSNDTAARAETSRRTAGARRAAPGTRKTTRPASAAPKKATRRRVSTLAAGPPSKAPAVPKGHAASTKRALWIESPDQRAGRPGQTLATQNHDVIRQWAEERGGVPATVPGTEHDGRPGVLRFDFPDFGGARLRAVDWDEWFETFDERRLVFLFQEQVTSGRASHFFRLDGPEREDA
jgi:hypothetical protein